MFGWFRKKEQNKTDTAADARAKPDMTPEFQRDSRAAAEKLSAILKELRNDIGPGITGREISAIVQERIVASGLQATMKGYRGFPHPVAISINQQVLHAGPAKHKINEGDLVTVQSNVAYGNGNANLGWTYGVGSLSGKNKLLLDIGEATLRQVESDIDATMRTGDIGHLIEEAAETQGLSVIREYCGFGMRPGAIHSDPQILCYGIPGSGPRLAAGDILNIHIIASSGQSAVKLLRDGWTVVNKDDSKSALFAAMFLVGEARLELMGSIP